MSEIVANKYCFDDRTSALWHKAIEKFSITKGNGKRLQALRREGRRCIGQ